MSPPRAHEEPPVAPSGKRLPRFGEPGSPRGGPIAAMLLKPGEAAPNIHIPHRSTHE